ncbi:MAG: hypothetical protein M1817_001827 [Caeruleum heppii]|nr:MAG: hypothetical protein M1817_001827 [Caeruleum heppii]
MPGPANTLVIEGPFEELAEELAQYIDKVKTPNAEDGQGVHAVVMPLLERNQKDEALKRLVTASAVLNSAPEKEFIAAYNLLIHLIRQSPNLNMFLPRVCQNLSNSPINSPSANGPGMALSTLSTIFNLLQPDNDVRYHVFLAILSVVKRSGLYEVLRPQLKNVDRWIAEWESDEDEQRKLFLEVADVATEAGEEEEAYNYLLRALRTLPANESSSDESRTLALRALKSALLHPTHFDFQDLTSLDSIQALHRSDGTWFELLEILNAGQLEDYENFRQENKTWFDEQEKAEDVPLDHAVLHRKIQLLTLASLASSTPSRSLSYSSIATALQIPSEEVEVWVIDVIRAGLVEGKLSQLNQQFLIHRATYRVFGERQWREVASRLDTWREALRGVLGVVKREREAMEGGSGGDGRSMGHGGMGMGRGGRGMGREMAEMGLD